MLAEYTSTSGNFPTITRVLLGKIHDQNARMSYVYDQYVFHYIVERSIIYMCMCDDLEKRRVPFTFLEDIKQRFQSNYGARAQAAIAFAMQEDFGPVIRKQMEYFNATGGGDALVSVNSKLEDVKSVMVQNIEMVMERGEKLEILVDKTDKLQTQAFKFEKSSRQLKWSMYWQRLKVALIATVVVIVIIWLLTSLICGFDYSMCKSQ